MSTVEEILTGPSIETDRGDAVRALRPARGPAGVVAAALLVGVTWTLIAAAVGVWLGAQAAHELTTVLLGLTWDHPAAVPAAIGMIVVGAGFLVLALLPGRPRLVPLESADPLVVVGVTRRGLRRTLAAAALTVPGTDVAYAKLGARQIEVTVITEVIRTGELLREVAAAVGDRLTGLGVIGRYEVVVRLRRKRI